MLKILSKYKVVLLVILIAIFFGLWAYFHTPTRFSYKCPNNYETAEEYIDAVARWMREEMDKNPNISLEELTGIRYEEFQAHGCEHSRWDFNEGYSKESNSYRPISDPAAAFQEPISSWWYR
jgi:hypothetical protein